MRSYTDTINSNATRRDEIINDFVTASGMERNAVIRMFESYQAFGNNLEQIKDKFDNMISPVTSNPLAIFNDDSTVFDDNSFNTKVGNAVTEFARENPYDVVGLLNIIANALRVKNPEFSPVFDKLEICTDIPEISSYAKLEHSSLNENENIGGTVELYSTLKDVLAKNNKRFGVSYHIENVYTEIWNYLNDEIERLTTQKNINSVSEDFKRSLVDSLVRNSVNPMYKQADYIKRACPDIQGLVFDMMMFFDCWVKAQDMRVFTMIDSKIYRGYIQARDNLFMSISSSAKNSVVVVSDSDEFRDLEENTFEPNPYIAQAFRQNTVEMLNVADSLVVIKAVQNEFNLNIRPLIDAFFTKASNLLGRAEHIIYELRKISMYK